MIIMIIMIIMFIIYEKQPTDLTIVSAESPQDQVNKSVLELKTNQLHLAPERKSYWTNTCNHRTQST